MRRRPHVAAFPMTRAWLIGAGPGDAELLTIKASRAITRADVVLVDALVNPDVLQFARPDAQIIPVGKRGGHASTPQADIIATMITHLQAGRSVARLKGGDPFVFGRGGEELQALRAAGIPVEVINGLTAGIAAPTALGIPVTHRGLAQGVIFVTGHSADEAEPDWRALAATGLTLVIYMGMHRLAGITAALLQAGMAPDTPCAAIQSATLPAQRHLVSTLAQLPAAVAQAPIQSPAIIVIGPVAALADLPADLPPPAAMPAPLALGIGCRRGVSVEQIQAAVSDVLGDRPWHTVQCIATLDTKAQEPALQAFCAGTGLPLRTFSAAEINDCCQAHPALAHSPVAQDHLGVAGVCEPCALLAAPGGTLLAPKYVRDGVTVALAAHTGASFAPVPTGLTAPFTSAP